MSELRDSSIRVKTRKKLIEVALPLEAINKAAAREKSIRHGHPSTLHLWWARRPLAAARAVIFAQMVDDPSSWPELFPKEADQENERQRLFKIIEQLVLWESTTNEAVLVQARDEIWKSWRRTCVDNKDHPRAAELFNPDKLPAFHDPFAGGGSLPLEAQRLGLDAYASDLNPVAVLINKAMIEIPPKFAGQPPVNPESRSRLDHSKQWHGADGLAEDIRYYGKWMRDEAEKRIGHLYPKVEITEEIAKGRPDLQQYIGKRLTVIAWLWARTVKSPNPAFAGVDVPLASTFMLCIKAGKEAYVEPVIENGGYRLAIKRGKPGNEAATSSGTKFTRGANFTCLMSGTPISSDYIKAEGKAGRMNARLMATVVEGERGRVYLPASAAMEALASDADPKWVPDVAISGSTQYLGIMPYGMVSFAGLFTKRQLDALSVLAGLVSDARRRVLQDLAACIGGAPSTDYADAITVYLGLCVSRQANRSSTLNFWDSQGENVQQVFARQALQMTWDYVECNPFSESTGNFVGQTEYLTKVLESAIPGRPAAYAVVQNARTQAISRGKIVSTDPPYYDNVPYADLSDYFYVWLRRSINGAVPGLFATVAVPKADELVAFAYRHPDKATAEHFFLNGMTEALHRIAVEAHPAFPITVFYAFRQADTDDDQGTASTGWDTFLDAMGQAGLGINGTWPVRTEYTSNLKTKRNALASSIVVVCRPRPENSPLATRRDFLTALRSELPEALLQLQKSNIAPVDLAQAAIGPGIAVYTRYSRVIDAEGNPVSVRDALALINQVLDEVLAEQEGDFDAESRWALAWFEQFGFAEGEYGVAETLSKAKNTSIGALQGARVLISKAGKVRLLKPAELPHDWSPDGRETRAWEAVHHLIRVLESGGERAAAELVADLGSKAEVAREMAYRLYTLCERKKRAQEAGSYNGLVQSWPEILRLAREAALKPRAAQGSLAL